MAGEVAGRVHVLRSGTVVAVAGVATKEEGERGGAGGARRIADALGTVAAARVGRDAMLMGGGGPGPREGEGDDGEGATAARVGRGGSDLGFG